MITKEDRARLRELVAKATPGPWKTGEHYEQSEPGLYVYADHGCQPIVVSEDTLSIQDRDFIAEARDAMPGLLDALDTAEAREAELEKALADLRADYESLEHDAAKVVRGDVDDRESLGEAIRQLRDNGRSGWWHQ
jgi:hypothetical protein